MPPEFVKCGWCKKDKFQNQLKYSKILDSNVCQDCDADNDRTDNNNEKEIENAQEK